MVVIVKDPSATHVAVWDTCRAIVNKEPSATTAINPDTSPAIAPNPASPPLAVLVVKRDILPEIVLNKYICRWSTSEILSQDLLSKSIICCMR
jgi:hypothetical protein